MKTLRISLLITAIALSALAASCVHYRSPVTYQREQTDGSAQTTENSYLLYSRAVGEVSLARLRSWDRSGNLQPYFRYPLRFYRISYRSTKDGNTQLLSALIIRPLGFSSPNDSGQDASDSSSSALAGGSLSAKLPVLEYHHGALLPFALPMGHPSPQALDAPSFFRATQKKIPPHRFREVLRIGIPAAALGYLVIMPDFSGYGIQAGEEHDFVIGPELSRQGSDLLRALREWAAEQQLELQQDLYLMGISAGAYSSLWQQKQMQNQQSSNWFSVKGGAYFAGPYDIQGMFARFVHGDKNMHPLYNWALYSIWSYYLQGQFSSKEVWQKAVRKITDVLLFKPQAKEKILQSTFIDYLKSDDPSFQTLLAQLSLNHAWASPSPIYLYHASKDPLVPCYHSEEVYKALSSLPSNKVELTLYEDDSHTGRLWDYFTDAMEKFSQTSGLRPIALPQSEAP